MFRYLERAENAARLLDAGFRLALTRDVLSAEAEWRSVIETAGQREAYERANGTYTGIQAWNFILRDKENPLSIRQMMTNVRNNARLARNAISEELWEAVNEGWMEIDNQLRRPVGQGSLGEVLATIRKTSRMTHGAMAGSTVRDEGFHFASAGTMLERADSTARILDIKYYLLLPSLSYVGSSLDAGQWDTILRSVSGDRAFRYLNGGKVTSRAIVEFLVLDGRFPRSLAFCHAKLREHLDALALLHGEEGESQQLMRDASLSLDDLEIEVVFDNGLHEFLLGFMARNAAIADAISEDYRFTA